MLHVTCDRAQVLAGLALHRNFTSRTPAFGNTQHSKLDLTLRPGPTRSAMVLGQWASSLPRSFRHSSTTRGARIQAKHAPLLPVTVARHVPLRNAASYTTLRPVRPCNAASLQAISTVCASSR